tara:strand:+ start:29756 stop:30220 length:465 start_codon:yes stop_codon:yes gene_type:complete
MSISLKKLKNRESISSNKRLHQSYAKTVKLVEEIRDKDLPDETLILFNSEIDKLNSLENENRKFRSQLRRSRNKLIQHLLKKHQLVTKRYYRTIWMSIGVGAFGVPLGVAMGSSVDNYGLIGTGLPIGLAIGLFIGVQLDNKAHKEGRQLDIEY